MKTKLELPSDIQNMNPEELEKLISSFEILVPQLKKLKEKKSLPSNSLAKFADEYLDYLKISSSDNYIKSVERSLNELKQNLGGEKSISEISRVEVNAFIAKLASRAKKGYQVYFRNLKAAFNIAVDWEYIEVNPFAKVKLPKKQKENPAYLTRDQLDLILGAMQNETLKAIIHYAFLTGSRRKEILNLRWRNIDFEKKIVTIGDEDFNTKTRKQRIVPMTDEAYTSLWKRSNAGVLSSSKPDGFVFAKPNGFQFHIDTLTKSFKKACRKVGIDEKIHFHSVRHSFASFLVQRGVGLYNVKVLMGHSSITTTEIYAHLNTDALKESVKVFDDIKK